jgi:hypothetical protein
MSFMYLHLSTSASGGIHALVQNQGVLKVTSLGGPNSQLSNQPFAVFRIESFDGLEHLSDNELVDEILRRFTTKELLQKLQIHLTSKELLELLVNRLDGH